MITDGHWDIRHLKTLADMSKLSVYQISSISIHPFLRYVQKTEKMTVMDDYGWSPGQPALENLNSTNC